VRYKTIEICREAISGDDPFQENLSLISSMITETTVPPPRFGTRHAEGKGPGGRTPGTMRVKGRLEWASRPKARKSDFRKGWTMANAKLFTSALARFLARADTVNQAGGAAYAYGPERFAA
jgi:hypothetical protein